MKNTLDEQKIKEVIESLETIEKYLVAKEQLTSLQIINDAIHEIKLLENSVKERKKISRIEQLIGKIIHWLIKLE